MILLVTRRSNLLALVLLILTAGCNSVPEGDTTNSRMGSVARLYGMYVSMNMGAIPKNLEQLQAFIDNKGSYALEKEGVASLNELLTSRRDGQPLVLLFGQDVIDQDGRRLVAYEQEGKAGSRMVAYADGSSETVDAERFAQMVPNP